MSSLSPKSLDNVVEALRLLPGVGTRSAQRYAYHLLKSPKAKSIQLSDALAKLHDGVAYCKKTFAFVPAGQEYSELYTDPKRDKKTVIIVAEPFDVMAIEATKSFQGTYHVLGGLLSPIDGITEAELNISPLLDRIKEDSVTEVILATNASVEGESTAHVINNKLSPTGVKVTRIAQGLPIGVDIEYADQITLSKALEGRRDFN